MPRLAFNHFSRIAAQLAMEASQIVQSAAAQVAFEARASMEGQEPPAPPGSPPAIRSGILHDSIESKAIGPYEAIAYTNVEYGPHDEYGTVNMEARPFMRPAAEVIRPSFERAMRTMLGRLR